MCNISILENLEISLFNPSTSRFPGLYDPFSSAFKLNELYFCIFLHIINLQFQLNKKQTNNRQQKRVSELLKTEEQLLKVDAVWMNRKLNRSIVRAVGTQ